MSLNREFQKFFEQKFGDRIVERADFRGELTFVVRQDAIAEILKYLHDEPDFRSDFLTDLTATDWPQRTERHEVIYQLLSLKDNSRVRLKVRFREGTKLPTATGLWDSAIWLEREVYDLFGIEFDGHPELTRILMPEDWVGFPLRKDYSLHYEQPQFTHNKELPPEVS